ncbi:class I SAM-dependent rRNA methyltransferase [Gaopeijia maritima]|uniref:Class I SAM-dependent rRNA methyltransferase n=1 Tax=Gaopeijia maritima TaxID=3119007 RepID=A0ABU9E785_9BACT
MSALPAVRLRTGRDGPPRGRHPWLFSGSLESPDTDLAPGTAVDVVDSNGAFVARGLWNPHSQIRVRLYDWRPDGALDDEFWRKGIAAAVAHRRDADLLAPDGGCRLVFSEGDGLSGLTVDRYARTLAVQFTSLALWERREVLLDALRRELSDAPGVDGAVLRTARGIREEEGLDISDGPLFGRVPDGPLEIVEGGVRYGVDLRTGQKTGAYLDQRDTRQAVAPWGAGRSVADLCCYTGGFSLHLARAGAHSIRSVDVSAGALERAEDNARRNGLDGWLADGRWTLERSDAFRWLEARREEGVRFGMIVLDPPTFARSSRGVGQALKGYARLNALAVDCLEPDGILVTCSCTGRVSAEQFLEVIAGVERSSRRRIRVIGRLLQPADHPVSPTCPETAYLKCVVCRVGS